jgi:cytochrome-b5 reductase
MIAASSASFPYEQFTVTGNALLSPDVHLITLKPNNEHAFHYLPAGHHVDVRVSIEGQIVLRPYTPVINLMQPSLLSRGWVYYPNPGPFACCNSPVFDLAVELVIRSYPNGIMSKYLCTRAVGDVVTLSKPASTFDLNSITASTIVFIAAGTGDISR